MNVAIVRKTMEQALNALSSSSLNKQGEAIMALRLALEELPKDDGEDGPSYAGFNFCPNCAERQPGGLHQYDGYTYCKSCDPE